MWPAFFIGLIAVLVTAFVFYHRRQERLIKLLRQQREEIQIEESRVFDFLHGLGAAFSGEVRVGDLHRLIVEGAVRILDAHGGSLYFFDKARNLLVPGFISRGCPPLVNIPPNVLEQVETTPVALDSFVRLHAVKPGEGLIGRIWSEDEALCLSDAANEPLFESHRNLRLITESVLLAPLSYFGNRLGVLAVANGPMGGHFSSSDFVVFKSIAEQSAFALYNAVIYSEVGEKKRMDHDLQIARDIQRILLPSSPPKIAGFEISGLNIPARQVSGDYFDYVRIDEHRWGIVIADVSGKGVPASLIMAMCRSVLRSQALNNDSPAAVLRRVNRQLYPDIKEDMFISMAFITLDQRDGTVVMARAGHDAPLLYSKAKQSVERVKPPGMALGIDSGDVFDRVLRDSPVELDADDCLVLYTDGVTEALDSQGDEFGPERLNEAISASASEGAPGVLRRLTEDVRTFVGSQPQNDDITLIAIRKL